METVESAESMLLCQISRGSPDRRSDFQREVARPVLIQIGFGQRVLLGTQSTFTAEARKGAPRFGIGDHRGTGQRRLVDETLDLGGAAFFDVELDETAGVEVEDQRRSSRTMADALFPRARGRRLDPAGLPPLQLATPFSTRSQARRSVPCPSIEISRATERPCSVITIRSPFRARRR